MIEFSNNEKPNFMYFAGEGSWGDASDIVVVNVDELDGHFEEMMEEVSDYNIPDFMRWYVDNQGHDQRSSDISYCEVCNCWESGLTEDEIIESLDEDEE